MPTPEPLRNVRRSADDRTWTKSGLARFLDVSDRQIDRYRSKGWLVDAATPHARVVFSKAAVQSFLEVHYYKLREARPGEFESSEVARG